MADIQRQLAGLTKMLEAVDILSAAMDEYSAPAPKSNGAAHPTDPGSMTDAIEQIVVAHGKPMTKAFLKERLQEKGFKGERLGNYFYTVVMRLKQRNKIHVEADGSVSPVTYAKVFDQ